ncbi:BnaA09g16880D [Brassica napus]|uniref:glutathione gamma-glutamylcysteinyltransferase n=1 Tax=Brassica napus TaxID=3708 RepID=A0A078FJH5_BRANA|nr:BnaA09g16880D [Brassica napus]
MAVASLYRRSLTSPPAIDFSSTDGKNIFKEAVQKGTMEGYFSLISYFQTLSEPAFSGLASLSVVLNALSIDSDRKWKGPESPLYTYVLHSLPFSNSRRKFKKKKKIVKFILTNLPSQLCCFL